eukprot:s3567_g5.t1
MIPALNETLYIQMDGFLLTFSQIGTGRGLRVSEESIALRPHLGPSAALENVAIATVSESTVLDTTTYIQETHLCELVAVTRLSQYYMVTCCCILLVWGQLGSAFIIGGI